MNWVNIRSIVASAILLAPLLSRAQSDPFEVKIDFAFVGELADQSQLQQNSFLTINSSLSAAQSFEVGITGDLVRAELFMYSASGGTFQFSLFEGDEPVGMPLFTQLFDVSAADMYSIEFDAPVAVTMGEQYTIAITIQGGVSFSGEWYKQNTNVYPDGNAFIGTGTYTALPNDDMVFATYVEAPDTVGIPRLRVTDDGRIGATNYLFPAYDGIDRQVLMTDGIGNIEWVTQRFDEISDEDEDTKIQVEESYDEDIIRMDVGGQEVLTLSKNANGDPILNLANTNTNVFVGVNLGFENTGFNNSVFGFQALQLNTEGFSNTAIGTGALKLNTTGYSNTAVGSTALFNNTTAVSNTAVGASALYYNTTGSNNSSLGALALHINTSGYSNSAFGAYALSSNTTGHNNTAIGAQAMSFNSSGTNNTALGYNALYNNSARNDLVAIGANALFNNGMGATEIWHAVENTAVGTNALFANTTGSYNVATGFEALKNNTSGYVNTAIGYVALRQNISGYQNTALGYASMFYNTTGNNNTAVGSIAGYNNTTGTFNTSIGSTALNSNTTGNSNTALGANALRLNETGQHNVASGFNALDLNTASYNTAVGSESMKFNETGRSNVAMGYRALHFNVNRHNLVAIGDSALYKNGLSVTQEYHATANTAIGSKALANNTIGYSNTAVGFQALATNTTGYENCAMGIRALHQNTSGTANTASGLNALYSNTSGIANTAVGLNALYANTTGTYNIALGVNALFYNTEGSYNIAIGSDNLTFNGGSSNIAIGHHVLSYGNDQDDIVAIGDSALHRNGANATLEFDGLYNTAIGSSAMSANERGSSNTATGYHSLSKNIVGNANTAIGTFAMEHSNGFSNTAVGKEAMKYSNLGSNNVAIGSIAMYYHNGTSENVAVGAGALHGMSFDPGSSYYATGCVAVGRYALFSNNPTNFNNGYLNVAVGNAALYETSTGFGNVAMGSSAGDTNEQGDYNTFLGHLSDCNNINYNNSMALGYEATVTSSNQIRIGNADIESIGGFEDWSNVSDARFKQSVQEDVPGLDFILALRPVTFTLDDNAIQRFLGTKEEATTSHASHHSIRSGFLAQEVEQAAMMTGYNFSGIDKPKNEQDFYSLRYAVFTVPLVKAVQELHAENVELRKRIEAMEAALLTMQGHVEKE